MESRIGAILIGSNAFMMDLTKEKLNDDLTSIISEFRDILVQL